MKTIGRVFYRGHPMPAGAERFQALGGPYASDGQCVYFGTEPLAGADPGSFRVLAVDDASRPWSGTYACDARRVFCRGECIEGADPSTFEVIDVASQLTRDADRVYDRAEPTPVQPTDLAHFRLLAGLYASDGNLVFFCRDGLRVVATDVSCFRILDAQYALNGEVLLFEGTPVEGADGKRIQRLGPGWVRDGAAVYTGSRRCDGVDATTFRLLGSPTDAASPCFARDATQVFWAEPGGRLRRLDTQHPDDFVVLDPRHGHDGRRALYGAVPLEGADPGSLQSLGHDFARDAHQVFHEGLAMDAHAPSFRHLGHHDGVDFFSDRDRVYRQHRAFSDHTDWWACEALHQADLASFTVLSAEFSRDAKQVFQGHRPLSGVDAGRFASLGPDTFTDGQGVWFHGQALEGVVASSFQLLGHGFATAATAVSGALRVLGQGEAGNDRQAYFHGRAIEGADPASFRPLAHGFARDARRAYAHSMVTESRKTPAFLPTGGALPGADPAHLRVLGRFHATDGRRVYWRGHELDGLDGAQVRVLDDHYATDGRRLFCMTQPVEEADALTFEVLPGDFVDRHTPHLDPPRGGYGKDRYRLFLHAAPLSRPAIYLDAEQRRRLNRLSAARFRPLDAHFGTDGTQVLDFSRCQVLDADAASFQPLGHGFGRDARQVFYRGHPVRDADVHTFEPLPDGHGRDARRVFHDGCELPGADPAAFRTLGHHHATDGASVFCRGYRLEGADAGSFEVRPDHGVARDAMHAWSLDGRFGDLAFRAGEAVEFLGQGYVLRNGIPHWGDRALRAEAATFEVLGDGYAQDAHNGFHEGRLLFAV